MMIQYQDGRLVEGVVLSLAGDVLRAAIKGCEDAVVFRRVNDTWISQECEPVQMWWLGTPEHREPRAMSESDFICPSDLAKKLVDLLATDSEDEEQPAFRPERGEAERVHFV